MRVDLLRIMILVALTEKLCYQAIIEIEEIRKWNKNMGKNEELDNLEVSIRSNYALVKSK